MTALKPSEVLSKAADLIEPKGAWTQHAIARSKRKVYLDGSCAGWQRAGCFCVSGAIGKLDNWKTGAFAYLQRVTGFSVPTWNDAPGRTQAEVVAALRKAADLARSEGQ